jgi:glutamate-1-semialdehyde 2,1-aminomutase
VYQAGTLSGNPLAMRAGLTQLKELDRLQGWQRLEELGAALELGCAALSSQAGKNFTFSPAGKSLLPLLSRQTCSQPG